MRIRPLALAAGIIGLLALSLPAPAAAQPVTANPAPARVAAAAAWANVDAPADHGSIFADEDPELAGSGWGLCAAPITWSVDVAAMDAPAGRRAIADLQWAFDTWAAASGLVFEFTGTTTFAYDDTAFSLTGTTPAAGRHIDIAFVPGTARLAGQTVGLGSPSQVMEQAREIVAGTAVFRADHATRATQAQARSLYLHELGHVLGLAHAHQAANVMYPTVGTKVALGSGDINGINALVKQCSAN